MQLFPEAGHLYVRPTISRLFDYVEQSLNVGGQSRQLISPWTQDFAVIWPLNLGLR